MFAQVGDRRGETPKIILNIEGNPKISNQSTGNVFGDNIGRDKGPLSSENKKGIWDNLSKNCIS